MPEASPSRPPMTSFQGMKFTTSPTSSPVLPSMAVQQPIYPPCFRGCVAFNSLCPGFWA
ncbi:unnamed protein product [Cyberlindnera jadinii]|uniref:Uncharacterized protein n=1 Tax=Cyberlindnera jadinii (strain ATCC 18201 / CBS 1600 / BCRC 20928 / JCM 3617 / NBRC 0987 / NRRL Y-1542) TaxID=983966 RepID=A0A0H5BYS4_CYBJN|nr:unnamed protein product [Cyberlindnera jadinii]